MPSPTLAVVDATAAVRLGEVTALGGDSREAVVQSGDERLALDVLVLEAAIEDACFLEGTLVPVLSKKPAGCVRGSTTPGCFPADPDNCPYSSRTVLATVGSRSGRNCQSVSVSSGLFELGAISNRGLSSTARRREGEPRLSSSARTSAAANR